MGVSLTECVHNLSYGNELVEQFLSVSYDSLKHAKENRRWMDITT